MGPVESGRGPDPGARKQPAVASAIGATSRAHVIQPIEEYRFTVASGPILAESAGAVPMPAGNSSAWRDGAVASAGGDGRRLRVGRAGEGPSRDYDDVPPVKGLCRGGGTENLRVAVSVLRDA